MKRRLPVILGVPLLAIVVACEGPAGPRGPAGADGAPGAQGPPGTSFLQQCSQCHGGSTEILSRVLEYEHSVHYTGGNFERARDATCAVCHSHEGFVERIAAGTNTIPAGIANPTPPNCRTCHMIHTNYDSTDLRLRATDPVTLLINDSTVDLGKGGDANLCTQCHQPRKPDPMPVLGDTTMITIPSTHYDMHHGTQGAVLAGTGAFAFKTSVTIVNGPMAHGSDQGGCPVCHMAKAYGVQAGGHTWNMTYTLHGQVEDNTAGCETCHSIMNDFDYANVQTHVQTLLDSLQVLLQNKGILDSTGTVVTSTFSSDLTAAYLNWTMFEQDGSMGVHNPPYVVSVLTNTIAAVNAMP
ncbi:MAG: collagen-like protein [Gemmatimonadota bacterium]